MAIVVKVSPDKKKILIEADIETLAPSASGKSLVVCSTRGSLHTSVMINERPLVVNLNAYISKGFEGPKQ